MNWFEKIRDNFIPITKLYNKHFYSDKVASVLLKLPVSEVNQETALVLFLNKGFSKHYLLKIYQKQLKLIEKIQKKMDKFRRYDARTKRYVQTVTIKYGKGIEYLILGELLEKMGFRFDYTLEEVFVDSGFALCSQIELVLNRIGAYYRDKNKSTLNSIIKLVKDNIKQERLARLENEQ